MKSLKPTTAPVTRGNRICHFLNYLPKKCLELFMPVNNDAVEKIQLVIKDKLFSIPTTLKSQSSVAYQYILCDCEIGYISCFEPYFGQPTTDVQLRPDEPFTSSTVMYLVEQLAAHAQGS